MSSQPAFKVCHGCQQIKQHTEFVRNKRYKFGLHSYCKLCQTRKSKEWRSRNREKYLLQQAEYRSRIGYAGRRRHQMKHKYGITDEQYQQMLEAQGCACAICGSTENGQLTTSRKLFVDHNHKTDKVRGLLCGSCNHGIGTFKENAELLLSAIAYLDKYSDD